MFQFRFFSCSALFRYPKTGTNAASAGQKAAPGGQKAASAGTRAAPAGTKETPAGKKKTEAASTSKKKRMSAANHPLLKPFFVAFPNFTRDPEMPPEANFRRLMQAQSWQDSSDEYRAARRSFLKTVADETKSPVHRYFFDRHEDFIEYDSGGSPRHQFDRLRTLKDWDEGDTLMAFYEFQHAFEQEFKAEVDLFFAQYPDFPYNPRGNAKAEFRRLEAHKGWDGKDINRYAYGIEEKTRPELKTECSAAQTEFYEAFTMEFEDSFGADDEDIGTWRNLCVVLGVDPIPETMSLCRKKLRPLNVNIYDLLRYKRTGVPFTLFPHLRDLRKYTIENELYYPLYLAKAGPLKFLLRAIRWRPKKRTQDSKPSSLILSTKCT